uniref:Secreted protein n=1 Tax=Ixodes ricinus TaxID=34613 RepID=A0A0K8REV9_IXORI
MLLIGKSLVVVLVLALILQDVGGINVANKSGAKRAMRAVKDYVTKTKNAMELLPVVRKRRMIPTAPPIPPEFKLHK